MNKAPYEFGDSELQKYKIAFEGDFMGEYLFWINGSLTRELSIAPADLNRRVDKVYQSETMFFDSGATKGANFQLFIDGRVSLIVVMHDARSLLTTVEAD